MNANCAPTLQRQYAAKPKTSQPAVPRKFGPASDIIESDDKVVLTIDLPGIDPKDISIKMTDGILAITANRERVTNDGEPKFVRRERVFGEFERRFKLPRSVDTSAIKANFKYGTLSITAPKTPQAIPRTIEINGN